MTASTAPTWSKEAQNRIKAEVWTCSNDMNCGNPGDIGANFSEQVRSAEVLNKQRALQNPLSPSSQVKFFFWIPLIIHFFMQEVLTHGTLALKAVSVKHRSSNQVLADDQN